MSDCVLIDQVAPQAGTVNDGYFNDVFYQIDDTMIAANWNGFTDGDKGSGIVEYKYMVKDSSGEIIVPFTFVGNATSVIHSGLSLAVTERYFVTVKAVDAVGLSTDVTSDVTAGSKLWIGPTDTLHATWKSQDLESDIDKTEFCSDNGAGLFTVIATNGTNVDLTAPSLADIVPRIHVTSCVTNCTLVSNITGVQDDESGVRRCSYAIRNSTDFVIDFVDNALSTTVEATGLQLLAGQSYYTVVTCENNVVLTTEKVSSPVTVDNTPPSKGSVIVSEDRTHDVFWHTFQLPSLQQNTAGALVRFLMTKNPR
ncbi:hypothetical protein OS493_002716 [Desmophyllum pertusum]|uniref:Uncharacterized protein n=1 Tax=Desmophyllum pertusum TaxID=174260 RepID=A0A9W9YTE0_9CNID|nr:hypothetical protein OS493_002716 [Desmophyllum pertusum]